MTSIDPRLAIKEFLESEAGNEVKNVFADIVGRYSDIRYKPEISNTTRLEAIDMFTQFFEELWGQGAEYDLEQTVKRRTAQIKQSYLYNINDNED